MSSRIVLAAACLAAIFAGASACQSRPADPEAALRVVTLSLTGTEGARFTGYYLGLGGRVDVDGVLPRTIQDAGIAGCEFRKERVEDILVLEARDGNSYLHFTAGPPLTGVLADLEGGWSVMAAGSGGIEWVKVLLAGLAVVLLGAAGWGWLRSCRCCRGGSSLTPSG